MRVRRGPDLPDPGKRVHSMDHDQGVRRQPGMHRRGHHGFLPMQGECVHTSRHLVPGRADRRDLRARYEWLLLRRLHHAVHCAQGLLGYGARCGVLDHLQRQLHGDARGVHQRGSRNLHTRGQRLPILRNAYRLRGAPELHGGCGRRGLYVQRGSGLQRHGQRVRELDDARDVLGRCAELPVRIGHVDLRQWGLQRRRLLHQHVLAGSIVVRQREPREVHRRQQRLLGVRRGGRLRRAPELYRGGRGGRLQVQHRPRLRRRRPHMRDLDDRGDVRQRRARLHLRIGVIGLHDRPPVVPERGLRAVRSDRDEVRG